MFLYVLYIVVIAIVTIVCLVVTKNPLSILLLFLLLLMTQVVPMIRPPARERESAIGFTAELGEGELET